MMTCKEIHLFIDDSGSRDLGNKPIAQRNDLLDYFALGGVLVLQENVESAIESHMQFCSKWKLNYPLHSWEIRGGRKNFGWLKKPENATDFLPSLGAFLVDLPVIGIAAVINRPGYFARYKDKYDDRLWLMCKTTYSILIERAAKYAHNQNRKLRIFFERAGKSEDGNLIAYTRSLKKEGMPFESYSSASYASLTAQALKDIIRGEPRGRTKEMALIQIADLLLYPMAKGGYDKTYRSYKELLEAHKLIDTHVSERDMPLLGIKYSCFEGIKAKGPA